MQHAGLISTRPLILSRATHVYKYDKTGAVCERTSELQNSLLLKRPIVVAKHEVSDHEITSSQPEP